MAPDIPWNRRWSSDNEEVLYQRRRWLLDSWILGGASVGLHMGCRKVQMMISDRHKNKNREFPSLLSPKTQCVDADFVCIYGYEEVVAPGGSLMVG